MNFFQKILKHKNGDDEDFTLELKKILGFTPNDISFYTKAFTHSSLKKTANNGKPINYERLEFLGDALLSSIIAIHLFKEIPNATEGYLTQMRSKIVSREHLNEISSDLSLINFVKSNVPKRNFGENIHGNIFEALIGAVYLDKGYKVCEKFVYKTVIEPYVDIERLEGKITSYKSLLIEWCQKEKNAIHYDIYEDTGNDTLKHFSVKLMINEELIAKGRATSKKKAEEIASKRAYYKLQDNISINN